MDLDVKIQSFIIYSKFELSRNDQVEEVIKNFPNTCIIEAIYPQFIRVPFLNKIIEKSKHIKGKPLLKSEIGVILSHRKIWKIIRNKRTSNNIHYFVFESDSKINNKFLIEKYYSTVVKNYDLFFWGAWNGNSVIKRSTISNFDGKFKIGEPFLETIYGAYAYSLNSKAAAYMLRKTSKFSYPIDIYKKYLTGNCLNIGTISPEIVGTWQTTKSNIRNENLIDHLYRYLIMKIFYMFYTFKSYFY